jgi:hypothetical protein
MREYPRVKLREILGLYYIKGSAFTSIIIKISWMSLSIADAYRDKVVLITGCTGFLGMILRMIYCCSREGCIGKDTEVTIRR